MFFTRFIFFLLAKRVAEQNGVPPDQGTRDALPALVIGSPIGFVLAIALAQQGGPAPAPKLPSLQGKSKRLQHNRAAQGQDVLGKVLAEVAKQGAVVPSFIGYSSKEARRLLDLVSLNAVFIEDEPGGQTVVAQRPAPGTHWKAGEKLELRLGKRSEER